MTRQEHLPKSSRHLAITVNGKGVEGNIECRMTLAEFLHAHKVNQ